MAESEIKKELEKFIEDNPDKEIPADLKRKIAQELKIGKSN